MSTMTISDRRNAVGEQITGLIRTAEEAQPAEGDVFLLSAMDAEALGTWDRLMAEYDRLGEALRVEQAVARQETTASIADDIYGENRSRQVDANIQAYNDLLNVGQNEYRNPGPVAPLGHPGELLFSQPAIVQGKDGHQVMPFPAVWDAQGRVNIEASYRWAEIIKASKTGDFDPQTGNRIEMAASDTPVTSSDIPNSIPDLVTDLYEYMFYISPLSGLCRLIQTAELNPLPIERRTDIPAASLVAEAADIGDSQPAYSELTLNAYKYAFISQYSYEASRQVTPWNFSSKLSMDAGIAFGTTLDNLILNGDGTNKPRGLLTAIKADSNQQDTSFTATGTTTGTTVPFGLNLGSDDVIKMATVLPMPYDMLGSARLLMKKDAWVNVISMVDKQGRPFFVDHSNMVMQRNLLGLVNVLLNDNVEATGTAGNYPFITAALETMALRMAGPMRVDFSSEYGFKKDLLSYRFALHWDCDQLDPNGAMGYKLQ